MLPRCPPWRKRHHWPPLNLPASHILRWMEINAAEGPPSCILSQPVHLCARACAVLVHILQKVIPARWIPGWRKPLLLRFDLHGSALCMVMGFQNAEMRPPPQRRRTSPSWMEGWGEKPREKKGASFSPYQLREAMLCPCNCVGISSISSATLDNKYRVHRQLLWDLKRGCGKRCACVCVGWLGSIVCLCVCECVCWQRKVEQALLSSIN